MAVARLRMNVTINEKFSGYGMEDLTLHLFEYPVTINTDYTITGTRATDGNGDPIVGVEKGDGQYELSGIKYGEYVLVAYKPGIIPQTVNGYDRFIVLPKLAADEIDCSITDATSLKTKLNVIIQYILDNDGGWTGTPPTLIT